MDIQSNISRMVARGAIALAVFGASVHARTAGAGPTAAPQPAPRPSGAPALERVEPAQITISGWRLDCGSVATTLQCQLRNQVVARASDAVISAISIRRENAKAAPLAVVQIPLGTAVDEAVRLGFSNGAVQRLPVHTCNRSGCYASDRLGEPIVAALRAAKLPLRIAYDTLSRSGEKQTVTISLGLDGFAAAYARLR